MVKDPEKFIIYRSLSDAQKCIYEHIYKNYSKWNKDKNCFIEEDFIIHQDMFALRMRMQVDTLLRILKEMGSYIDNKGENKGLDLIDFKKESYHSKILILKSKQFWSTEKEIYNSKKYKYEVIRVRAYEIDPKTGIERKWTFEEKKMQWRMGYLKIEPKENIEEPEEILESIEKIFGNEEEEFGQKETINQPGESNE